LTIDVRVEFEGRNVFVVYNLHWLGFCLPRFEAAEKGNGRIHRQQVSSGKQHQSQPLSGSKVLLLLYLCDRSFASGANGAKAKRRIPRIRVFSICDWDFGFFLLLRNS
jgi:hypothetical protein